MILNFIFWHQSLLTAKSEQCTLTINRIHCSLYLSRPYRNPGLQDLQDSHGCVTGGAGKTANREIPPMVQPAKTKEKEISIFNAYDNAECQIPRNMNLKTVRESFVQYQKREYPPRSRGTPGDIADFFVPANPPAGVSCQRSKR